MVDMKNKKVMPVLEGDGSQAIASRRWCIKSLTLMLSEKHFVLSTRKMMLCSFLTHRHHRHQVSVGDVNLAPPQKKGFVFLKNGLFVHEKTKRPFSLKGCSIFRQL